MPPKRLRPFWSYVEKTETCWLWKGTITRGYGMYSQRRAHRISWEQSNGKIESYNNLHHKCGNKACVNPLHLEKLTRKEHFATHMQEWLRISRSKSPTGKKNEAMQ